MAYNIGDKINHGELEFVHIKHLMSGRYMHVDKFVSTHPHLTNGHNLVIIKTPRNQDYNHVLENEEETLHHIEEDCRIRQVRCPVAKYITSMQVNGLHLMVMESSWQSLEELLRTRPQADEDECLQITQKIITLVDSMHLTQFLNCNVNPSNVIVKFPSDFHRDMDAYGIVEEAIGEAQDEERRLMLQNILKDLPPLQVHEPYPFPYNVAWAELNFTFSNASSAIPLAEQVVRHAECREEDINYLSPEALLRGWNAPSSDLYSACLVAARVCLGVPLIKSVGGTRHEKINNCLHQMFAIKQYFREPVLKKYDDRDLYFHGLTLTQPTDEEFSKKNLRTILRQSLLEISGWSEESYNKIHSLLASGLKHNATERGNAEALLNFIIG